MGVNKSEFFSKLHQQEEISNRPLVDFDNLILFPFDNYSVLTDLKLHDFNNFCFKIPPTPLRNSQNRLARSVIACLLMKLRLDVGHQEPATLFPFPAKRYVSRVIHSTRKALIDHFVPHRLGFNHISRQDVIDLHTWPISYKSSSRPSWPVPF